MSDVAFVLPLFLLLGVGGTLVLSALIQSETKNPRIVVRETAEREVQERSGLDGGHSRENPKSERASVTSNECENESENGNGDEDENGDT